MVELVAESHLARLDSSSLAVVQSKKGVVSVCQASSQSRLKAVDTIGNCQRLAFTVGVSQQNA